jgi:hypothetical protein
LAQWLDLADFRLLLAPLESVHFRLQLQVLAAAGFRFLSPALLLFRQAPLQVHDLALQRLLGKLLLLLVPILPNTIFPILHIFEGFFHKYV